MCGFLQAGCIICQVDTLPLHHFLFVTDAEDKQLNNAFFFWLFTFVIITLMSHSVNFLFWLQFGIHFLFGRTKTGLLSCAS